MQKLGDHMSSTKNGCDPSVLLLDGTDDGEHLTRRGRQVFIDAKGGDDVIDCGPGSGVYLGRGGADIFRMMGGGEHWIADFDRTQGDKIDVSRIGITDMLSLLKYATNKDQDEGCAAHVEIPLAPNGRLVIQIESQTVETLELSDFIFAPPRVDTAPTAHNAAASPLAVSLAQTEIGPAALVGQTLPTEIASLDPG
ncbi:hypothetical protein ACFQU1_19435 [Chelatococcus sp. GCM10030263]|uniref:hypothetical protein n=1 Tax=Chelatococcus sp. GCM10030263 TaxID=3273387 RepID=UPI00361B24BF